MTLSFSASFCKSSLLQTFMLLGHPQTNPVSTPSTGRCVLCILCRICLYLLLYLFSCSLFILCPVSLFFSLVYPAEFQQDSSLLSAGSCFRFLPIKESFSCHCAYTGVLALGFCLWKAPRQFCWWSKVPILITK